MRHRIPNTLPSPIATAPIADRALTRRQAAELTGYSEKTLANFATRGKGPPYRQAHCRAKVLYMQSELMAWLAGLPSKGESVGAK